MRLSFVSAETPRFTDRWVRLYTRGLPPDVRAERRAEIASDVYEQCSNSADDSDRGVRVAVFGRTLRGLPGDVMWRFEEGRAMKQQQRAAVGRPTGVQAAWATVTQAWFTPLAVLVGFFDLAAAVFVITDTNGKMPGQAIGPIFLVGFACAMFTGLWLRWRSQFASGTPSPARGPRPVSGTSLLIGLAFLAVALVALGAMTSPLPLVVGVALLVVVVGVAASGVRRHQTSGHGAAEPRRSAALRSSRSPWLADGLIVAGTLPAIGLFWMVIPPIVALAVIGGVIGTQPGTRSRVPA